MLSALPNSFLLNYETPPPPHLLYISVRCSVVHRGELNADIRVDRNLCQPYTFHLIPVKSLENQAVGGPVGATQLSKLWLKIQWIWVENCRQKNDCMYLIRCCHCLSVLTVVAVKIHYPAGESIDIFHFIKGQNTGTWVCIAEKHCIQFLCFAQTYILNSIKICNLKCNMENVYANCNTVMNID